MRNRTRTPAALLCLPLAALLGAACGDDDQPVQPDAATPDAGVTRRLVVLATTDEHSHLFGYSPESDDYPLPTEAGTGTIIGGYARIMAILEAERAAAQAEGIDTVTVSGGDMTAGALSQTGFTTRAPDFVLLEAMGYDVATLGNHEFDFRPAGLAEAITAAQARGGLPVFVSSNIHFSDTDSADDTLAALYGAGTSDKPIKPYHVITTPGGIKVGFVGFMGAEAAYYAPEKPPVRFSAPTPAQELDLDTVLPLVCADVQPAIDEMRDVQKVDVVVALSHAGVGAFANEDGEDYRIAGCLSGVDVILSGHSHRLVSEPLFAPDADGREVRILPADANGRVVARMEIVVPPSGRPTLDAEGTGIITVDDRTVPSQTLAGAIDDVIAGLEDRSGSDPSFLEKDLSLIEGAEVVNDTSTLGDLFFRSMGTTTFDVMGFLAFHETNGINLSADSMLATARALVTDEPTLLAVQTAGSMRAHLVVGKTGHLSFADLFRVVPLGISPADGSMGFPLMRFYLFAGEVRGAMEVAVSDGLVHDSMFLVPTGLRVEYDVTRPVMDFSDAFNVMLPDMGRTTKLELVDDDGTVIRTLFDASLADPWPASAGGFELIPVVTSAYVASFASTVGVTLKDKDGFEYPSPSDTILQWPVGGEVKEYQAFIKYVYDECNANGGQLPSRYDVNDASGQVPRHMICVGTGCE